jgi:hypothetical protein
MRLMLVMACALALSGCAGFEAWSGYQKSLADYSACLRANPNDVRACDDKRLAMRANERAYNKLFADISEPNSPSPVTAAQNGRLKQAP